MYQFGLPYGIEWYERSVEWLSDAISPVKDDREFYSHLGAPLAPHWNVQGPPRNPLFDTALVHYYCVAAKPLDMPSLSWTKWIRRAVGTGWNAFQLRHTNFDGYLECETLVIIYDELDALQFKLAVGA